jgi:hypothetical protein
MELNDYQLYKVQEFENSQVMDEFKTSHDFEVLRKLNNKKQTDLKFGSYILLPGDIFWNKLEPF